MYRILILLLIIFPLKLLTAEVEIIANVNGEPISSLDVEKRVKLVNSLFSNKGIDKKELKFQMLKQLIDEMIILNEASRLNIKLNDEELNNAVVLFINQSFGLKAEEIKDYLNQHQIDANVLTRQIRCQLLWNKIIEARIVPFINGVSNEEVKNFQKQIEKPDHLITIKEWVTPNQHDAQDLVKGLHNESDFVPKFQIKKHKITVNLNQVKGELKNALEKLEIGEISDSIKSTEGYSVIKVIDKVKLDHGMLNSTLSLKQTIVNSSDNILEGLKKQKVNCSNFDTLANNFKLSNVKEFQVKIKDLNPELQILFSRTNINEIIEINEGNTQKLIMLCDVKSNVVNIETIKQQIYQQKIITQSSLLFDDMRRNSIVNYHNKL